MTKAKYKYKYTYKYKYKYKYGAENFLKTSTKQKNLLNNKQTLLQILRITP